MLIHTEEDPYGMSIHTVEEHYINDFIIFRKVHNNSPMSSLLVKINYFGHRELLAPKLLLI